MGLVDQADFEPSATPRLSLSKLPNRHIRDTFLMPTPPNKTLASVPFQWEEAPGKPRPTANTSSSPSIHNSSGTSAARRLDLPPRLLFLNTTTPTDSFNKIATSFYSPTTVLDGPYERQSFSQGSSFSVQKEPLRSLEEEIIREANHHHHRGIMNGKRDGVTNKQERSFNFPSWGLGSLKERNRSFASETTFGFSSSASSTSNSHKSTTSKLPRLKRRSTFASLSHSSSNFLAGIYGSFKQVVHWRRRQ